MSTCLGGWSRYRQRRGWRTYIWEREVHTNRDRERSKETCPMLQGQVIYLLARWWGLSLSQGQTLYPRWKLYQSNLSQSIPHANECSTWWCESICTVGAGLVPHTVIVTVISSQSSAISPLPSATSASHAQFANSSCTFCLGKVIFNIICHLQRHHPH